MKPFKVPKKTTVWKKEPKSDLYSLNFAPELITFIIEKRKWRTYRFGNKYDYLNVGDEITVRDNTGKLLEKKGMVAGKRKVLFKDLLLKLEGYEEYESKERQRKVFSGYYAFLGRETKDNDKFLVIDFKLV